MNQLLSALQVSASPSNSLQTVASSAILPVIVRNPEEHTALACEPKVPFRGVYQHRLDNNLVENYLAKPIDLSFMKACHCVESSTMGDVFLPNFAAVGPHVRDPTCLLADKGTSVRATFDVGDERIHVDYSPVPAMSKVKKWRYAHPILCRSLLVVSCWLLTTVMIVAWWKLSGVITIGTGIATVLSLIVGAFFLSGDADGLFQLKKQEEVRASIPVKFPGIVPQDVRALVHKLTKEGYATAFVFEAKPGTYDVKNAKLEPKPNLDPLLIAFGKMGGAYLICAFDVTPAEQQVADEFTS